MGELLRRRAMMVPAGNAPLLPAEYQQVEFLQAAPPSQYGPAFDTGYRPTRTGDIVLEVDCMPTQNVTATMYPIGVASTSSNTGFAIAFSSNGTNAHVFNGASAAITLVDSGNVNGHRFYLTARGNMTGYESIACGDLFNETTNASPRAYGSASAARITLFGVKKANVNQYMSVFTGRIYYARVSENGEVKREMIPCYRKSDGEPGFYDLVTKAFKARVGSDTSEILIGPEV